MEKMVYERPVMRAQAFQANASVAACNRVPGDKYEYAYMVASLNIGGVLKHWIFGTDPQYSLNDGNRAEQWYFHEYDYKTNKNYLTEEHAKLTFENDNPGVNNTGNLSGTTGTYFLEWSNSSWWQGGQGYYIYEDLTSSGYDPDGDGLIESEADKGIGSLQVNGNSGGNGGYNELYGDEDRYGNYYADRSVMKGTKATVETYKGTNLSMIMSG